ncbi:MAG TPA: LLM class flavin-dependent oxidoreductase, partial [Polyangia bacterium]
EPLAGQRFPELTSAGRADAAIAFSARHADVHLLSSPERVALADESARLRQAAKQAGRDVSAGVRLTVIARATEEAAKQDFERAIAELPAGKRTEVIRPLEPHLWSGFDRLGAAGAHGLVGSYETVAAKLNELAELGIRRFVLAGRPHLEEAYRFAEHVAPKLHGWAARAKAAAPAQSTFPASEATP